MSEILQGERWKVLQGDCREVLAALPAASVNCCVTSPPYFGLRDYGLDGQIGLEQTPAQYVAQLVAVFAEVWRVLKDDGSVWLNLGDSYANDGKWGGSSSGKHVAALHGDTSVGRGKRCTGLKPKDLIGIPWRVAFALQDAGWYLRSDIVWHKPNPMPESVTDRPTRSHEFIFLLTKSERYYYDAAAIKEPCALSSLARYTQDIDAQEGSKRAHAGGKTNGTMKAVGGPRTSDKQRGHSRRHAGFNERWDNMTRTEQCSGMRNKRDVWTVATRPYKEAHFATFPPELIRPCILAGCPFGGIVLDPFSGSGTTGQVAIEEGRRYIGAELNPEYIALSHKRIGSAQRIYKQEALF